MIDMSKPIININTTNSEIIYIIDNLRFLYSTKEGSIPLDRNFGISTKYLDYPIDVAKNYIALEIIEKTEIYAPRIEVEEVNFKEDINGMLIPIINITINQNN